MYDRRVVRREGGLDPGHRAEHVRICLAVRNTYETTSLKMESISAVQAWSSEKATVVRAGPIVVDLVEGNSL